jgi:AcrR family transcriptional regulator
VTRQGGEVRRHALIEEAIRAFGREGYSGASLDQIATAVGIRKQTLLYYFPTKDALLEACLQAAGQRVAQEIADALEGKTTYWDRAEAVIHAVFGLAEEWPEFPMFVREAGRLGAEGFERFASVIDPLRKRAVDFLQSGMDAGEIREQEIATARMDACHTGGCHEQTGEFLWQLVVPKLAAGKVNDWEALGLLSSPAIERDRLYVVTTRCEVLCLTTEGLANNRNVGPFEDEGQYIVGPGKPKIEPGTKDADIVWRYDMIEDLGVFPHNGTRSHPLSVGNLLYVATCNGMDWTHTNIPSPDAPSLIALDKRASHRARNVLRWFLRQHHLRPPSTARLAAMHAQLVRAAPDARVRLAAFGAAFRGLTTAEPETDDLAALVKPASERTKVAGKREAQLSLRYLNRHRSSQHVRAIATAVLGDDQSGWREGTERAFGAPQPGQISCGSGRENSGLQRGKENKHPDVTHSHDLVSDVQTRMPTLGGSLLYVFCKPAYFEGRDALTLVRYAAGESPFWRLKRWVRWL